jgi:hypothetical protein
MSKLDLATIFGTFYLKSQKYFKGSYIPGLNGFNAEKDFPRTLNPHSKLTTTNHISNMHRGQTAIIPGLRRTDGRRKI